MINKYDIACFEYLINLSDRYWICIWTVSEIWKGNLSMESIFIKVFVIEVDCDRKIAS